MDTTQNTVVHYWLKRLDHTLAHTQSSSRLIYIVDGAVLVLLYFAIQNIQPTQKVIFLSAFPTFLLAILNLLHARLIIIQHSWYLGIDNKLKELLDQKQVEHRQARRWLASAHHIYSYIHIIIAIFLVIVAIVMYFYGYGYFSEIMTKSRATANPVEAIFVECKLPNVIPTEFLINVEKSTVLNSQEFVDPFDGTKTPSFKVLSIVPDNIQLIREYEGMLKGKKGKIKELVYINRYNLRATDRVWLNDNFITGGDGSCKMVDKKL
jgi:hypothetical protein